MIIPKKLMIMASITVVNRTWCSKIEWVMAKSKGKEL